MALCTHAELPMPVRVAPAPALVQAAAAFLLHRPSALALVLVSLIDWPHGPCCLPVSRIMLKLGLFCLLILDKLNEPVSHRNIPF